MKCIKKLKLLIQKRFIEFYNHSKLFRSISNSLGIGISSSFFYGANLGGCACCGNNPTTCVIGIGSIGFVGLIFGFFSFLYQSIRNVFQDLRGKLNWKENKEKRLSD
jgi:hypothetical protein